jgi:hypothetical protein
MSNATPEHHKRVRKRIHKHSTITTKVTTPLTGEDDLSLQLPRTTLRTVLIDLLDWYRRACCLAWPYDNIEMALALSSCSVI